MPRRLRPVAAVLAIMTVCSPAAVASVPSAQREHWVVAWTRSPALPSRSAPAAVDQTLRVVTRPVVDGSAVRVVLSANTLLLDGRLVVGAVTVGRRAPGAAVAAGSLRALTFGGERGTTVPAGGEVVSDAVRMPVRALQELAVSVHVVAGVPASHPEAHVTSSLSRPAAGDLTRDVSGAALSGRTTSADVVAAIEVLTRDAVGAAVAIGGSVTDGAGGRVDRYEDYPSQLAVRLRGARRHGDRLSVVNQGIGGTTASSACASPLGPSAVRRFDRDVAARAGVTHLLVYAGTNDVGNGCTAAQIVAAFRELSQRARTQGIRTLISTITPRAAYTAEQNAVRGEVNRWVRRGGNCSGTCAAAMDFDAVLRDPVRPTQIRPDLDSGDGIHPNARGYRLLAAAVPLRALHS